MIATSISKSPRSAMMSSRLPTLRRTCTPGRLLAKLAIRRGEKYFAVLTAPTESRPAVMPLSAASCSSQAAISAKICPAASRTTSPASVGRRPLEVRSNSTKPASTSSCCSCSVTAGGVRFKTLAALTIFPSCPIAVSARSCFSVTFRNIADSGFLTAAQRLFKFTYAVHTRPFYRCGFTKMRRMPDIGRRTPRGRMLP